MEETTRGRATKTRRLWLTVAWLPVVLVVTALLVDLISLHLWQHPSRLPELETWLAQRETPERLPGPPVYGGPEDAPATVWIAGGSSVVLPDPAFVADVIATSLAEAGAEVRVANLGGNGADLTRVIARFEGVLENTPPPDVLILYVGHNDLLAARHFFGAIRPMQWTTGITYAVSVLGKGRHCGGCSWQDDYDWYRRNKAADWLDTAQRLNVWTPAPDYWTRFDAVVLDAFERRVKHVLRRSEELGIQVILETPVGNLDVEPRGYHDKITALRAQASKAPDLATRTQLLQAAQDLELYSPDIRASSAVHRRIHDVGAAHGVPVFDVGRAFVEAGVPRNGTIYSDAFHYREKGHVTHFGLLARWMMSQPDVAARLRAPGRGEER